MLLTLLRGFLAVWDLLTWPIYQVIYKPWEVRELRHRVRAKPIKKTSDEIIYESVERESELYEDMERHKVGHNIYSAFFNLHLNQNSFADRIYLLVCSYKYGMKSY